MNKSKYISIVLLIGAILYWPLPFDLCPDITPFIGFLDDLAVTLTALLNVYVQFRKRL